MAVSSLDLHLPSACFLRCLTKRWALCGEGEGEGEERQMKRNNLVGAKAGDQEGVLVMVVLLAVGKRKGHAGVNKNFLVSSVLLFYCFSLFAWLV